MKHSAFSNPGRKRRKIPSKLQKSAMQRDSLWSISRFSEEFRKDLLKKKTKRGENGKTERQSGTGKQNGKAEQQNKAERGEITKRRSFCGFCTQEPSENNTFCKRNEAMNPFFVKYSPKYKEYRAEEHRQAVGRFLRLRGSVPCGGVLRRSYIRAEALSA